MSSQLYETRSRVYFPNVLNIMSNICDISIYPVWSTSVVFSEEIWKRISNYSFANAIQLNTFHQAYWDMLSEVEKECANETIPNNCNTTSLLLFTEGLCQRCDKTRINTSVICISPGDSILFKYDKDGTINPVYHHRQGVFYDTLQTLEASVTNSISQILS